MTTVDIPNGSAVALPAAPDSDGLRKLAEWVEAARNATQLVAPLVDTPFVPEAYRPRVDPRATPEQIAAARQVAIASATAAVLQGITLGLDPMTALQQIYVVHGRPGMYTEMKVALVKSRGHEIWTEDVTDTRAVVCGRRKGSEQVERVVVTMDQAKKAGWTSNAAYQKTPQDMLYARAAGRVADRIAPEVLLGIATVEEIRDEIRVEAEVGTRTVAPRRRPAPVPAAITATEEPPLEPEPSTADETPAEPEPIDIGDAPEAMTQAQGRKLYALLRKTGREDKGLALGRISAILERDVASTKELSKAEAITVIDALEAEEKGEQPDPWAETVEVDQPELEP